MEPCLKPGGQKANVSNWLRLLNNSSNLWFTVFGWQALLIYLISNFAGQHQLLLPFRLFEARLTTLHSNHFNCSRAGIIAQTTGEVLPPFNSKQCPGTIEDGINKGISGLVSANSGISLISIAGSLPGQIKAMLSKEEWNMRLSILYQLAKRLTR